MPAEWVGLDKIPTDVSRIGQECQWYGLDWSELIWEQDELVKSLFRISMISQNCFRRVQDWSKVSVEWMG